MGASDRTDGADGLGEVERRRKRRRLLIFGLIAAAVIGVAEFATELPSERVVVVQVADGAGIDRVELVWHEKGEAVHRSQLAPPFDARSSVRLTEGSHRLRLNVRRGAQVTREDRRVDVVDGVSEIVVSVH